MEKVKISDEICVMDIREEFKDRYGINISDKDLKNLENAEKICLDISNLKNFVINIVQDVGQFERKFFRVRESTWKSSVSEDMLIESEKRLKEIVDDIVKLDQISCNIISSINLLKENMENDT